MRILYNRLAAHHPWSRLEDSAASHARRVTQGSYRDPDFLASASALYRDARRPPEYAAKPQDVKWKRPDQITPGTLLFNGNAPIIQGDGRGGVTCLAQNAGWELI